MYIYTKKKVIEIKNEVKCNFLGRNDGVTLRKRFLDLRIKYDWRKVWKGVSRKDPLVCNGVNSMFSCLF